ncbi:MAG: sulfatase [Bacteroidota bacterium]
MNTSPLVKPLLVLGILSYCWIVCVFGQQRPNVLLIISDDLNTRIGPYMEIDQHTPHLDRLAKEGVRFRRVYSQYPLCGPSRASIMSGLYPETNKVMGNSHVIGSFRAVTPSLSKHPSLAGFFREQGYFSARVSKIFHMGVPGGIERGEAGGDDPDSWDFATNIMGPETLSDGELELLSPGNLHYGSNFSSMILKNELEATQTDYLAASQAIAILENRAATLPPNGTNKQKPKAASPFFLAVGLVRPHVPLIAPENCFEPYPASEVELPKVVVGEDVPKPALRRQNSRVWEMDETQKKKTISAYMASVRFMDQQVGRLLDALDRLDLRKETIVVFLSDHGYNLGEHDCWSKISLWEGSVRVPLIISDPSFPDQHGKSYDQIAELIDLYPSLVELGGFTAQQPSILQGKSLAPLIMGKEISDQQASIAYTIGSAKGGSIRSDRWRYTRWGESVKAGNEELYDHDKDPEEHMNLANQENLAPILQEMRSLLESARHKARMSIGKE